MLAIPFWLPLARFFFGNRDQFLEDVGLTSEAGTWGIFANFFQANYRYSGYGWYSSSGLRGIVLRIMCFVLVWAALTVAAYHLVLFVARWFV